MPYSPPKTLALLAVLIVAGGSLTGCGGQGSVPATQELAMAPLHAMHIDVQQAPVIVQEAYQFAVANREVVEQLPCYCGCGPIGHKSNYDCYVAEVDAQGVVTYDPHALGCQICVDITQDTMRMMREGRALDAIQKHVTLTYSRYGPSNMP